MSENVSKAMKEHTRRRKGRGIWDLVNFSAA
jgi:hypothetical protein